MDDLFCPTCRKALRLRWQPAAAWAVQLPMGCPGCGDSLDMAIEAMRLPPNDERICYRVEMEDDPLMAVRV